jgi:Ca2+:H+ antiporter
MGNVIRTEWALGASFLTAVLFWVFGDPWLADLSNPVRYGVLFLWLFGMILLSAFAVVRHADALAVKLGEPFGTLILTLSVISIEVMMVAAVMLTGEDNPTLARDTMYAVIMIVMNGLAGIPPCSVASATRSRNTTCAARTRSLPSSFRLR